MRHFESLDSFLVGKLDISNYFDSTVSGKYQAVTRFQGWTPPHFIPAQRRQAMPTTTTDDINDRLTENFEKLALELRGTPSSRASSNLRFGTKRSLSVEIAGPKRGSWFCHETNQGGGPLQLIQFVLGVGYADALAWARVWLGNSSDALAIPIPQAALDGQDAPVAPNQDDQQSLARQQWNEALPISRTPAEEYLTVHRMIPTEAVATLIEAGNCPVRFQPAFRSHRHDRAFPALLLAATDANGFVQAVQGVRLTNTAQKLAKDAKRTVGPLGGTAVRLPGRGELILAEGPETALSVWAATRRPVWIALGGITKLVPIVPIGAVTIARDADAAGTPADLSLHRAAAELQSKGCKVTVVAPPHYEGQKKTDWNDVLRHEGLEAVTCAFAIAKPLLKMRCSLPPYFPAPTEPRDVALKRQRQVISEFFESEVAPAAFRQEVDRRMAAFMEADRVARGFTDFNDLSPRQLVNERSRIRRELMAETGLRPRRVGRRVLLTGSQGSGKSSAAAEEIAAIKHDVFVWWVVPELTKADEQAAEYRAKSSIHSMPALVVRGRRAADPVRSDMPMCPRHKAVERASEHGINVRTDICPACHLRDECGYLRQEAAIGAISRRGLFVMAREYLFTRSPAPEPGMVVADEAITMTAVQEPVNFGLDRITEVVRYQGFGLGEALEVRGILGDVGRVIATRPDILAGLRAAGIDDAKLARAIAYLEAGEARTKPLINGSMSDEAIIAVLDSIQKTEIRKVLRLLRQLRKELPIPRAQANTVVYRENNKVTLNGKQERQHRVFVYGLKKPQLKSNVPVLLLDGTGNPELNQKLFGKSMKHEHITVERQAQVSGTSGKSYSDTSISHQGWDEEGVLTTKAKAAKRLRQDIVAIVERQNGPVFVSTSKKVRKALEPELPADTKASHFNAVRGVNAWAGCQVAVIVGRQQPSADVIEDMTRPFTQDEVEPLLALSAMIAKDNNSGRRNWLGGYVLQTRARRMRDGSVQPVEVQVHPDRLCQAVLEQIREAEIAQAADRVRAIYNERTIVLLNNLVIDITYDRIVSHPQLAQGGSRIERALQRAPNAMPTSYGELARCFPDLWPTKDAAASDLREKGVEPYIEYLMGKHTLLRATYRRPGQRGSASSALVRAALIDPRAALERVVGPVVAFAVVDPEGKAMQ